MLSAAGLHTVADQQVVVDVTVKISTAAGACAALYGRLKATKRLS